MSLPARRDRDGHFVVVGAVRRVAKVKIKAIRGLLEGDRVAAFALDDPGLNIYALPYYVIP